MRDVRGVFLGVRICASVLVWVVWTTAIGARALLRFTIVAARWRHVFSSRLHCARGHATPAHGVFECRCGALVEDWVFAKCPVCRQSAGWTPCRTCGLPIRNPLLV